MSLKCSLLGHRFDESAVEHDREEDGSEVVIVTTELEACTRCGETRVVSENKEVRTTEAPEADTDAETAGADAETAEVPSTGSADDSAEVTDDAVVIDDADDATAVEGAGETTAESTGAELIDEAGSGETAGDAGDVDDATASATSDDEATAEDGPAGAETSAADGSAEADDTGADETTDPAEEDAEILGSDDAGAGSTEAEADAQSQARSEPTQTPDAESAASVPEAGTDSDGEVTDDAVIIDGDSDDERESGEWPEEAPAAGDADDEPSEAGSGSADAEWPEEEAGETEDGPLGEWPEETMPDGTDEEGAEQSLEETASPTVTVPEGMYKCPECGFTADVESSPHRAGDFCPECHRGTLVQDEDDGN